MRIWVLTSEFTGDQKGGIARYVDNFSAIAAARGHDVLVIGRAARDFDEVVSPSLRRIGFVPRYEQRSAAGSAQDQPDDDPTYPYNVIGYAAGQSFEIAQKVTALLSSLPPPDVIECQEFGALGYYLLHRKLQERGPLEQIPIVIHLHAPMFELFSVNQEPRFRLPDYWTCQMEKACIVMADAIVSPSRFLAQRVEHAIGAGHLASPIRVIPYPVAGFPASTHSPRRKEAIYIGRLQVLKGVIPMLDGCERMWSAGADFRLTCIGGDTVFRPRGISMTQFIHRKFADRIREGKLRLLGPLDHSKALEHLESAWVSIIGSHFENFPNVCIESMERGTLVAASRSGGQEEIIAGDGKNGLLFDWNIQGDFERALNQALQMSDAQRLELTTRAARRVHELCKPETVLSQRIEHFEQTIRQIRPRVAFPTLQGTLRDRLPRRKDKSDGHGASEPGLLSVVVPFYNLAEYVQETVDSIQASTYEPIEIVLVDDGSTDPASARFVRNLQESNVPGLRVVQTPNGGLAATRNNGADAARGEFLCFVDADDCVEPTYFERSIQLLRRYANLDFVTAWCRYFGASRGIWPTWNPEFPYLLCQNMSTAFSVMRRSAFLKHGRNRPSVAYALEDHDMWISMLEGGCEGVAIPAPLVRYRIRPDSMLRQCSDDTRAYLLDLISHSHPELYREFGVEVFNLLQANGPNILWRHPGSATAWLQRESVELLESQRLRIVELESELRNWQSEATRLSTGWESQNIHIQQQAHRIGELQRIADSLTREAHSLSTGWESQNAQIADQARRIRDLEKEAASWWEEAQRLSKAWSIHNEHIQAQALRIRELEQELAGRPSTKAR